MYNLIHDCKSIIRIKLFRKWKFGTLEYFQLSEICLFAYNMFIYIFDLEEEKRLSRKLDANQYTQERV